MSKQEREEHPRILRHVGGGKVELRCSAQRITWGMPFTGSIQLWAGHKPLWIDQLWIGLRPEFCVDVWDWSENECMTWSGLNLAPHKGDKLRFTLGSRSGPALGVTALLEAQVQLWGEPPNSLKLRLAVLPSAEFTTLAGLLQETVTLAPPVWYRPTGAFDAAATFAPGEALRSRLDEVTLQLLRERDGMSGELILNERERTPADYLRAARGRDRRILPFRWALDDLEAARGFFASALRPYVDTLVQLPIPAGLDARATESFPLPFTPDQGHELSEFLLPPATPPSQADHALEFILPERKGEELP